MFKKLSQYYQIFCNLSLDVAFGVFFSLLSLSVCFKNDIPFIAFYLVPACTWIIYLFDHVLDVIRNKNEYPSPRHRFIRNNLWQMILAISFISLVVAIYFVTHFNFLLFVCGLIMLVLVLVHFILVQINPQIKSILNNKEFAVAFIYASGIYILFIVDSIVSMNNIWIISLCYFIFVCVSFINLLMVSLIENNYDVQMQNSSLVTAISLKRAQILFYIVILLVLVLGSVLLTFTNGSVRFLIIIYMLMAVLHFYIYMKKNKLTNYLAYRKIGELIFWLPAIVYFIFK